MDQKEIDELLLYCIGIEAHEMGAGKFENLSADDWDEIIQMSHRHRAASLLYYRLHSDGLDDSIPDKVKEELQEIYRDSLWRNTQKYYKLSEIIKLLKRDDVQIILLKGIVLADLVYESVALRPMSDIDLLAKGEDIWKIDRVLSQLRHEGNLSLTAESYEQEIAHINKQENDFIPSRIDIHTRLLEIPDFDLWANASTITIVSTDALMPGAEDFLLHLCAHLYRDLRVCGESRLLCWYDIAKLLKHYEKELDWDYIIQTSQKHRIERDVQRILSAVADWFDLHVPAKVTEQLADDSLPISINDILHPTSVIKDTKFRIFLSFASTTSRIPSIGGKIRYIFRAISPRRKFMIQRYSISRPKMVYFYYPLRIIHGGLTAARSLFRLPTYIKNRRAL